MTRTEVVAHIRALGLVPVVRAASTTEALRAVDAVRAGGLDVFEITLTVPGALSVIEELARRHPDAITGAGTVLDADQARAAIDAGARFVVSPGFDAGMVACCRERDIAVFPGALTPTEVIAAWRAGADMVKIFPAGAVGGASYIKALKGPLPQVEMIPTGGVSLSNAGDFIRAGAAAVGVGGELVDAKALAAGKGEVVTERTRELLRLISEARA
jgi:2-dehydro-3-deoxyphosphogluconate aldolase/(4S)-4-hydroxy-2-oxoglutarate aldolase